MPPRQTQGSCTRVGVHQSGKHPLAVPCFDAAVKRSGDKPHYMHERAKSLQVTHTHAHTHTPTRTRVSPCLTSLSGSGRPSSRVGGLHSCAGGAAEERTRTLQAGLLVQSSQGIRRGCRRTCIRRLTVSGVRMRVCVCVCQDFESAKEYEPSDPRLVVNYRQVHHVRCIVLGPSGHEDPSTAMQQQQDDSRRVGIGQYGGAQLVTTAA